MPISDGHEQQVRKSRSIHNTIKDEDGVDNDRCTTDLGSKLFSPLNENVSNSLKKAKKQWS